MSKRFAAWRRCGAPIRLRWRDDGRLQRTTAPAWSCVLQMVAMVLAIVSQVLNVRDGTENQWLPLLVVVGSFSVILGAGWQLIDYRERRAIESEAAQGYRSAWEDPRGPTPFRWESRMTRSD